ncbi:uncharacterized protein LOC143691607 [Tamandua tetradactyla]|uniref:uncharacterized protein LOC143691607 n=1 Tax=Tamandua tetradactyla TaxID=48850 RepID=UPI004053A477
MHQQERSRDWGGRCVSPGSPRRARVPGTDLGRGKQRQGGGHVSAGVASPLRLQEPPGSRLALLQSPECWAETRTASGFVTPAAAQAHPGVGRRSPSGHLVCIEGRLRSLDFLK